MEQIRQPFPSSELHNESNLVGIFDRWTIQCQVNIVEDVNGRKSSTATGTNDLR